MPCELNSRWNRGLSGTRLQRDSKAPISESTPRLKFDVTALPEKDVLSG